MSNSQPLEKLNIFLPQALETVYKTHDTEFHIYKSVQQGIYSRYIDNETWVLTVSLIDKICRGCGALKHGIGRQLVRPCSGNHSWDKPSAILIFGGTGETLADAIRKADEKAVRFLQEPEGWDWGIQKTMRREEYLLYREFLSRNVQDLLSINRQLSHDDQKTLLKIAKQLGRGNEPRIIGSE